MHDSTARAISTVGIWLAVSIILTFGVFRMNWNDMLGFLGLMITVVSICTAAGYGTAAIWGYKPEEKPARQNVPGTTVAPAV